MPSLLVCGRSSETPADRTGRCGASESGRVLLDRRIGRLVPVAAARLAAAPGGVPTERTKGRPAWDAPSFYGGGIVIGRRQCIQSRFAREFRIGRSQCTGEFVGRPVCGQQSFHAFQIVDLEAHGFGPGRSAVSADEELGARCERPTGLGDLGVDGCRRGDLQGIRVYLRRSPVGVADLAADEDARGRKVGRGAAVETERNPRPPLRSAEGHFVRRSRRPIDDRVAEGLREVPHHAVVDRILREGGHPCGHDRRVVACPAHMVVGDARFDGLAERVEVGVVFGDVFAEQRLFQRDDRLRSLDDVACVAECVVGVVDMQSEIVEIVRFECSFRLCHSCNR